METSIYHTITTYGLSFLSHPIVIMLLILTVFSIVGAMRYKPHQSPVTKDGVHARRNLSSQWIFYSAIFLLALIVLWDITHPGAASAVTPVKGGRNVDHVCIALSPFDHDAMRAAVKASVPPGTCMRSTAGVAAAAGIPASATRMISEPTKTLRGADHHAAPGVV